MTSEWQPPSVVERDELVAASRTVLALPSRSVTSTEDVLRVSVLGLDWDIGIVLHQPDEVAVGPDGKKIGILVLHPGDTDFKDMQPLAELLTTRFGFAVFTATFPGRFYFDDPEHDWPADTILGPDIVRTPIWQRGEHIGPDEYDVLSVAANRQRWGTRTFARAREHSRFYDRMAAWPAAFEEGLVAASLACFDAADYSVYGTGHSTGGTFICMLAQRIPNFVGLLAMENSTFGYTKKYDPVSGTSPGLAGIGSSVENPIGVRFSEFNDLYIRTWRDLARYTGPEVLGDEGGAGLLRLPALMEDVLAEWESVKGRPQFKAETMVQIEDIVALADAANAVADRLALSDGERSALTTRYVGYTRELSGPDIKPMPNVLISIAKNSRDHRREMYTDHVMPAFRAMNPAPRIELTEMAAGGHYYWKPLPDLPLGLAPAVVQLWRDAIDGGYFQQ